MKAKDLISLLWIFAAISCSCLLEAQTTVGSFESSGAGISTTTSTDYQCLGVNPANLGFQQDDRFLHFTLAESSFALSSDALSRKDIWKNYISISSDGLSYAEKIEAAQVFAGAGFVLDFNITLGAISLQNEKSGGLAFMVRERLDNQFRIQTRLADLLFLGYNAPVFDNQQNITAKDIFEGSRISGSWYREYMVGYGRRVLKMPALKLYVGADVKYIQGYGNLNIYTDDNDFYAKSSITPFMQVDYQGPSPTALAGSAAELKAVGHGLGFDFGATLKIIDKIKVGLAINDIGSITWDGETYEAPNITVDSVSTDGFDSYNLIAEFKPLFENNSILKWQGAEQYTTGLPAHVKLGCSFMPIKWFEFGVDMYAPLNNHAANLEKAIFSAGGYFRLGNITKLSMGYVNGDIYHHNIPMGLVFCVKWWEFGMATGDVFTFFRQDNPTLSLAVGFLRFKFGLPGV
ncbi:MAG: DUF5723 family protein [Bacteroidota bacterium]